MVFKTLSSSWLGSNRKQNLSEHGSFGILVDVSLFSYETAGVGGYNVEHTLRFLKVFTDTTYITL